MLPVTLAPLGLVKRRTGRNKEDLPSLGSTCTVTLTSLWGQEDTQLTGGAGEQIRLEMRRRTRG